ncbi:MAG: glycoside hydrolase family 43 protein [Candidatus Pedobacter colombiensis]|uniref:Glycoside hydrolase family 43 protein n=1 Tax=Candidatus Pedobacter colombiensis TaxID=3121371 RepID=A0AAJ6B513_9SPHI|nr:glycoside hydrolase family 43 protein [Pedobacter sp.]WEK17700.1 MAG: glycoside hydrolase family 43 protein [Pedobacter sp.]
MKRTYRLFLLFGLAVAFSSCSKKGYLFTSFHEPANEGLRMLYSYDGYKWQDLNKIFLKPEIGKQKIMRDPSMIQGPDGLFHLVWTCGWKGERGFGYASSKDLIHWSEQQFIPVLQNEPTTVNVWAPELFYDEIKKEYIIIWASTIPYRFEKGIEEEENNHRMYAITTKDFKTFSEAKLFLDPGFSVIDAVIVKKAAEDYVLVLKDNTRPNRNLKVAFSKDAYGPYTGISEAFSGKLTEGPTAVKIEKDWLIYYDAYGEKRYAAMKTSDFKSFKDVSAETVIPKGHKHGTIVPVNKKVIKRLK